MTLTVVIWRDVWTIVHLNLLTEDSLLSGYASLVSCCSAILDSMELIVRSLFKGDWIRVGFDCFCHRGRHRENLRAMERF